MATRNANTMYTALFSPESKSVESPAFYVSAGTIVQLQAFNFMNFASRADKSERQVPQVACLEQILFKQGVRLDLPVSDPTSGPQLFDLRQYSTEVLAKNQVIIHGCPLSIGACNNQIFLNMPGAYRFVLNDQNAVGIAQLYMRVYSSADFPWYSRMFMGE